MLDNGNQYMDFFKQYYPIAIFAAGITSASAIFATIGTWQVVATLIFSVTFTFITVKCLFLGDSE